MFQLPSAPVKVRLACPATFLRDRSRVTDRSIGSGTGRSVTAARGRPAVFIYYCKHRGLKGRQKAPADLRPRKTSPRCTGCKIGIDDWCLPPSRILSRGFLLDPSPLGISRDFPYSFFLSVRTSLPLFSARILRHRRSTPDPISEWRHESEWDARRKGQPVDCRSTWTIVKSRDATETYVPRIMHVVDEKDRRNEISREGLKSLFLASLALDTSFG